MKKDYTKPEMTIARYVVEEYLNNGHPVPNNNKCTSIGDGGDCAKVWDPTKVS